MVVKLIGSFFVLLALLPFISIMSNTLGIISLVATVLHHPSSILVIFLVYMLLGFIMRFRPQVVISNFGWITITYPVFTSVILWILSVIWFWTVLRIFSWIFFIMFMPSLVVTVDIIVDVIWPFEWLFNLIFYVIIIIPVRLTSILINISFKASMLILYSLRVRIWWQAIIISSIKNHLFLYLVWIS